MKVPVSACLARVPRPTSKKRHEWDPVAFCTARGPTSSAYSTGPVALCGPRVPGVSDSVVA